MQNLIKIQKISKKDIPTIQQIEQVCFPFLNKENFDFVIKSDNYLYYSLVLNSKIIGYVGVSIQYDESDLNFICVLPEFRGKGYSKLLLEFIIDKLKSKNIKKLFLEVSEDNVVAINLYKSFGFILISKRKNYYHDKAALVMVKEL